VLIERGGVGVWVGEQEKVDFYSIRRPHKLHGISIVVDIILCREEQPTLSASSVVVVSAI
jgi:hypothetical protein